MIPRCFPSWSRVIVIIAIGIVVLGVGQAVLAQPFQPINLPTPTPTQPLVIPNGRIPLLPTATIPPAGATEEPIVPTEAVTDLEDQAQPTPEPLSPLGSIIATLHGCPIYTDPASIPDPGNCVTPIDGVPFQLVVANSGEPGTQEVTGAIDSASAIFNNLQANDYMISMLEMPDGYQKAFIWACRDLGTGIASFSGPPASAGASFTVTLGAAQSIGCDFYVVEDDPTFDISVDKFSCPEGTGRTLDLATLKQLCPYPLAGISFQTHDYDLGPQTTDANGHAGWTDVTKDSQGKIGLGEEVPIGYGEPVVWCATVQTSFDAPFESDYVPIDTAGGWFELAPELHEPYIFTCTYFNMPLAQVDQVLTIHGRLCQPGNEGIGADLDAGCLDPANDVDFTVTSPTGTTTQTTAFGETTFPNVAGGEIAVTPAFPPGYDEADVACHGSGIGSYSSISIHYPTYDDDFEGANFPMVCVFSFFPIEQKDNQVTLVKWDCPPGTSYGLQAHEYTQLCTTEMSDVPFVLTDDLGDHPLTSQAGGITWTGVVTDQAGSYQLTETVPDGYGEPISFCWTVSFDAGPNDATAVVGDTLVVDRAPSTDSWHERCNVYNMPGDGSGDNTVLIDKFRCPEGTGVTESFDVYLATCIDVVYDAEFTVTTAAGMSTWDTSNGQIVINPVPDGTVEIQEQIPAGFGAPVIFCDVDGTYFAFPSPSGYVARDVANAGVVSCMYFNIPADGGSITIEKRLCPVDFDLAGLDLLDALNACPGTTDPFTFSATGPNGALPDQQTGDLVPGAVVFAGIPAGSYTITETVPAGYTAPIVLRCDGFISGQLQPYPLATGDSLTIDLADGEHLTCHWLNVPESDPHTGTLTVIKYTCSTETFVSTVDCQIEEDGQEFALKIWDGDSYEPLATGTTNAVGEITWSGLAPGTYLLEETGASWCHLVASIPSPPDINGLMVESGQENVVQVFNCDGTPGDPGDTPTKYPDTGVEPVVIDPTSTVPGASMFAPGRPATR